MMWPFKKRKKLTPLELYYEHYKPLVKNTAESVVQSHTLTDKQAAQGTVLMPIAAAGCYRTSGKGALDCLSYDVWRVHFVDGTELWRVQPLNRLGARVDWYKDESTLLCSGDARGDLWRALERAFYHYRMWTHYFESVSGPEAPVELREGPYENDA